MCACGREVRLGFACGCVLERVVCRVRFARVSCPWLRFEEPEKRCQKLPQIECARGAFLSPCKKASALRELYAFLCVEHAPQREYFKHRWRVPHRMDHCGP